MLLCYPAPPGPIAYSFAPVNPQLLLTTSSAKLWGWQGGVILGNTPHSPSLFDVELLISDFESQYFSKQKEDKFGKNPA